MIHIEIDPSQPSSRRDFDTDDYVLYRDPAKYLMGKPDHTTVARVRYENPRNTLVPITDLATGEELKVDEKYLRPIPAAEIMRDIDTAPLNTEHPDLIPAAVAWLQQNARSGGDV